jgi:hypothetical protein
MIHLKEYMTFNNVISEELINLFDELDNSTYSDTLITESLLADFIFETTENVGDKNTKFITNVLIKLRPVVLSFNKWAKTLDNNENSNESIKQLVKEKNDELIKKYNEFINKWFSGEAKKILGLDNENEISTKDINNIRKKGLRNNTEAFKEDKSSHIGNKAIEEILNYKTTADTEIKKKIGEIKKGELEENKNKLQKQLKDKDLKKIANELYDGYKEIEDKIRDFKDDCPSADKSIETFNNRLSLLKMEYTEDCIINAKDVNDANEKLNEFNKNKDWLLAEIQDTWDKLDKLVQIQKEEGQKAADNAAEVPEEVKQVADTEIHIIQNILVNTIAQKLNIDVKLLGKVFVKIEQNLLKANSKTEKQAKNIAQTDDNDAYIGLNLMTLGALGTKDLQNRSKVISTFCTGIKNLIENQQYDKLFNQKPEENK